MRICPPALAPYLILAACCSFFSAPLYAMAGSYPPPPEPPPPPAGAATTYYSTCGGSHPPVKYVSPTSPPGTPGYHEFRKYTSTPAYRRYHALNEKYKRDHADKDIDFGSVDSQTGEAIDGPTPIEPGSDSATPTPPTPSTPSTPGALGNGTESMQPKSFLGYDIQPPSSNALGEGGMQMQRVERNPKQDLARWFRGFLYHEAMAEPLYSAEGNEPVAALSDPEGGPPPANTHYGKLLGMLRRDPKAPSPLPNEMLVQLDALWQGHWKPDLGFARDVQGMQLALEYQRVREDLARAQARYKKLAEKGADDPAAKQRVMQQLDGTHREVKALQAKAWTMHREIDDRLTFIRAMSALVRLNDQGGFGPYYEKVDRKAVQRDAAAILGQIGPMAAPIVFDGWLQDAVAAEQATDPNHRVTLAQAEEAARALLKDPRINGLSAVCDFINEYDQQNPEAWLAALSLYDQLGTKKISYNMLGALGRIIKLRNHRTKAVGEKARWVLLRALNVREGKASMEEAIGHLAPLLREKDEELVRRTEKFLQLHTGQRMGRNADQWLKLRDYMRDERLLIEAQRRDEQAAE